MRNVNEEMKNGLRGVSMHLEQPHSVTRHGISHFSFPFLISHFSFTILISHFSFLLLFLLSACGVPEGRFRMEGSFQNMNQGEFYVINRDKGIIDTLAVRNGRFTYDISLQDTATLTLLFPNFSELPIFARPASEVSVEGDVSHLKETSVKGTDENKLMTEFRMNTNELTPPEVQEKARQFIIDNPQSAVSIYLLDRYFIQALEADYSTAFTLCDTLLNHQPENVSLVQLHKKLKRLRNMYAKGPLPQFSATDTKGRTVSNATLDGRVNVIVAWASWSFESQNAMRQLNTIQKSHPDDIKVISVCLDASKTEGRLMILNDSITWPQICDGRMWDTPILEQLGLTFIPDNIVVDKYGNIMARSLSTTDLRIKIDKMLQ